ncbi:Man1-Src1p-C-terminal domain-containing protein [Flammula alnicola]|nr:Man1-Src1p-C-terminal domain-containing protein [Flammula alnicola]
MSRMTAAQVISVGEYLEPEFEPSSLTVSQLLGVLGYHNIPYPTPYTKTKLVLVFNNEVKTRAAKFKKERIKKENSIASEDGITDGHTGRPLGNKGKAPAPLARRSSRRLSQAPTADDSSPTQPQPESRPEPPKRRRSSAQPNLGGSSRRVAPIPVTLIEESEPEEEEILPAKKVGRTKKLTSAGAQGRRVSHISGGEDSGWEDNNIFQSGAESSSPARPSPVRPRAPRTSGVLRKTRKSTSAPPQMPDSSPLRLGNTGQSPPQSAFTPSLPPIPFKFPPPAKSRFTPIREFTPAEPVKPEQDERLDIEEVPQEVSVQANEVESNKDKESEIDEAISRLVSEEDDAVQVYTAEETRRPSALQLFARAVTWLCILASTYAVFSYKVESSAIGYCDRGSNTSLALEAVLAKRATVEACTRAFLLPSSNNSSDPELNEPCPLPPLVPVPHPNSCTPCPDRATCSQFSVACDSGYLLKPNILLSFIPVSNSQSALANSHAPHLSASFFKTFSDATSGLPGFGSVGLPPRCVEDPQRKRNIGALGKAIESMLGKERGRRVCRGDHFNASDPQEGPEEAVKWGVEIQKLREVFRQRTTPSLLPVFDDMFNEAIQQLTQWGGVFLSETADGTRYVAHKTPEMSWDCIIIVKSRELWAVWRTTVLASILAVLATLGLRIRMTQKQKENRRIAGLVQVALDTLRNQELAHYTDPLTAPQPYLSSIQLRDLVLQDEHSVPTRRRLWERVERVVESNANVRANLEEIEGGDETRVWRWVGSTGTGRTPGRKEVEYEYE